MNPTIPARNEIAEGDKWNLASLYQDDGAWEKDLVLLDGMAAGAAAAKEGHAKSADAFLETLALYSKASLLDERLEYYAHLRVTEDEGNSESRGRISRYMAVSAKSQAAWSWLTPAIQALPDSFMKACLSDGRFADYRVFLEKLLRFKPYILSEKEERLLALQAEVNQTAQETFGILTNVDLAFGQVDTPEGPRPLSQSAYASLMRHRDRDVRKRAYMQFYGEYDAHRNTIASLYASSVKLDKYRAEVRGYPSAREMELFPDNVPVSVYDNLVSTINDNLPVLHEYYELRRRALGVEELRHYDAYVPIVPEAKSRHSYGEAVDIVSAALAPLGEEYVSTLRKGLLNGWVDRYENKGKRSGAFSAGTFAGNPYILLNYKEDVLGDVFTMSHEGGHSMHSWYSARNNPFMCYNYTIFEAEVASTFNEQFVFAYLYDRAAGDQEKAFLLANRIDDTLGTLFRQTMFAEFEAKTHAMLEAGEPLTVDTLRAEYRKLLVKYFGPVMRFEEISDLEGLRIPHFYNAFYVYKYATGISASIALSERVMNGGKKERDDYFAFLKSGGSRFPIDALKVAGVDMASPEPIRKACGRFAADVKALKEILKL